MTLTKAIAKIYSDATKSQRDHMIDVLETMEKCGGPGGTMGPCPGGGREAGKPSGGGATQSYNDQKASIVASGKKLGVTISHQKDLEANHLGHWTGGGRVGIHEVPRKPGKEGEHVAMESWWTFGSGYGHAGGASEKAWEGLREELGKLPNAKLSETKKTGGGGSVGRGGGSAWQMSVTTTADYNGKTMPVTHRFTWSGGPV